METYSNQLRSFHLNLKCNFCKTFSFEVFVVFCCVQCLTITNPPIFSAILAAYILLGDKDKCKSTIHCCYRILLYGRSTLTRSLKIWTTHFRDVFSRTPCPHRPILCTKYSWPSDSHSTHFFYRSSTSYYYICKTLRAETWQTFFIMFIDSLFSLGADAAKSDCDC